jgi:hypothetical protein
MVTQKPFLAQSYSMRNKIKPKLGRDYIPLDAGIIGKKKEQEVPQPMKWQPSQKPVAQDPASEFKMLHENFMGVDAMPEIFDETYFGCFK